MFTRAGIRGIGLHLPEAVRHNDAWPPEQLATWRSLGAEIADPFHGAIERRVHPDQRSPTDMAVAAGIAALVSAGIDAAEIDVFLVSSNAFGSAPHPLLHRQLGLPPSCMAIGAQSIGCSFAHHLALAAQMVVGKSVRNALQIQLVHTWAHLDPTHPLSAQMGHGATAAVIGPVAEDVGLLGEAHRTDGAILDALPELHGADVDQREVAYHTYHRLEALLSACANELLDEALAQARIRREDVDFFASHRVGASTQPALRASCGLDRAAHVNTFAWMGDLSDASIPASLALAASDGVLQRGSTIAMFSVGIEGVASCLILRWGT